MLVPVTSTPLTVVRPEHSGMAASVTNTSREMGAVFGVAVLGSIVNGKLTGQLAARLKALGIPPNFQTLVIHAVDGRRGWRTEERPAGRAFEDRQLSPHSPPRSSTQPMRPSGPGSMSPSISPALLLSSAPWWP